MKVIVSGGGTGGHIYPLISIIEQMRLLDPTIDIIYVGNKGSLEERIATQNGLHFFPVEVQGVNGKKGFGLIRSLYLQLKNTFKVIGLMNRYKPHRVLTAGGYVSGPTLLAAVLTRKSILMHEQNAFPGAANRLFSRFADKVFLSFPESMKYFPVPKKRMMITGNPIRASFLSLNRKEIRKMKGLEGKKMILSVGGSGGAKSLNDFVLKADEVLKDRKDVIWVHVTGKNYYESYKSRFPKLPNLMVYDYLSNMPENLVASDIVISRSGANALTEISAVGIPSILVPSPNVANDHQMKNAKVYEENGAAYIVRDDSLDHEYTYKLINDLLDDDDLRQEMASKSKNIGLLGASHLIAQYIIFGVE
ncbi:undecaprenyldiphospho-muramoylpentapeptide beta-N-acetylglucosaminyltransferase [Guggenheimella bovis]